MVWAYASLSLWVIISLLPSTRNLAPLGTPAHSGILPMSMVSEKRVDGIGTDKLILGYRGSGGKGKGKSLLQSENKKPPCIAL